MTFDDVLGAAQHLPAVDKIRLIGELWDTMPFEDWPKPSDEWIQEAQRRSADLDADRMTSSPWPEVRERIRKKADLDG